MVCKNTLKLKQPKPTSACVSSNKVVFNYEPVIVPMRIVGFQEGLSTLTT